MSTPNRLIVIVLDRSGSMQAVKTDTEGGLRAFLAEQADVPGETRVTLRQFDSQHDTVFENVPLADVPDFQLKPRGMTALLDAIGTTISTVAEQVAAMAEDVRPSEVIVVILTDGHENASTEWKLPQVKSLISARQDGGWTFVFLGADQDAISVGGSMGIRAETSIAYASAHTEAAMSTAGKSVARGSVSGLHGFTDDERNTVV